MPGSGPPFGCAARHPAEQSLARYAAGTNGRVMLYPPGVYRANGDTELLADIVRRGNFARGRDVLDIGTGSGALALAAARAGAASVTAVDLSLRSVVTTWLNSRLAGVRVRVCRGDLFSPVAGRRFGLVLSNPPYVPAATATLPRHRRAAAGTPGATAARCSTGSARERRACSRPTAAVLLVHSALCDSAPPSPPSSASGWPRASSPGSPCRSAPSCWPERRCSRRAGSSRRGQRNEELVVVEGRRDG